jgi:hypothetical protein
MSPVEHGSHNRAEVTKSSPDRIPNESRQLRFAFWGLGTLVMLCLLLVVWFWTVILCPPHSDGVSHDPRTRMFAHARSDGQTKPGDSRWGNDPSTSAGDSWQSSDHWDVLPTGSESPSR